MHLLRPLGWLDVRDRYPDQLDRDLDRGESAPVIERALRAHRHRDRALEEDMEVVTVLPEFLEFSKGSVLFAHNAAFDKGFLEVEKEFCWGYMELPEILCSMKLSQSLFPTQFRHNLDILSQRFEVPFEGERHKALPDVIQTAKILIKMLNHGKISSMDELRRRAGLQAFAMQR